MSRVVATVEARMSSTRLPGKVMANVGGTPAIERLFRRLSFSTTVDDVVLATSEDCSDDPLVAWAELQGIQYFRGSLHDVLGRVSEAHRLMQTDVVVEITGDCPLIDARIVDAAVRLFESQRCHVVTTTRMPSYPGGVDVQVFRAEDLFWVEEKVSDPVVREHVSLYFYENPSMFHVIHMVASCGSWGPEFRLQLDYPEDLGLIRTVFAEADRYWKENFSIAEVLRFLRRNPEVASGNAHRRERPAR